jgi:hypothetical protein
MKKSRGGKSGRQSLTPSELLAGFPSSVQALVGKLRKIVMKTVPTATERVYPVWRAIGYREPQAGYFCGIFPYRDHVKIYLEHGASLPDPDELLEGDGRQTRYVMIRTARDIRPPALQRLLVRAVLHGSV